MQLLETYLLHRDHSRHGGRLTGQERLEDGQHVLGGRLCMGESHTAECVAGVLTRLHKVILDRVWAAVHGSETQQSGRYGP